MYADSRIGSSHSRGPPSGFEGAFDFRVDFLAVSYTHLDVYKRQLDIFAVGTDKGIYTAAWQPGDTSWKGWWRIQNGTSA